jgi:hypothetical protein
MTELPQPEQHTVAAILAAYTAKAANEEGERTYLGMSTLGTECDRALWYTFRWASPPEKHDGRMLRLFQTGHREEERMIDDLRMAGVDVQATDPTTGGQWAFVGAGGHMRGHADGKALGIVEAPKTEHLLEFKTHSEKSFKALLKDKVEKAKPGHFSQMQLYMHFGGLTRAFYLAHNKNTDELYSERIEYDALKAMQFVARAERIIKAQTPPAKLHDDPTAKMAWHCNYCAARGVCHEAAWPRTNCRTCLHSTPVEGGWHCARFGKMLETAEQRIGCPAHLFVPQLVPGEQIDVDEAAERVIYKLPDGSTYVDGQKAAAA